MPTSPRDQSRKQRVKGVFPVEGQPTIVYDTICTQGRVPWLANAEVHQLLSEIWKTATAWRMGRYVLMPDHLHYFAGYCDGDVSYDRWVVYWKSRFSNRIGQPQCRFQAGGFDRRVRSAASYESEWRYLRDNPVRAGLVMNSDEWPFQGEIHPLRWD